MPEDTAVIEKTETGIQTDAPVTTEPVGSKERPETPEGDVSAKTAEKQSLDLSDLEIPETLDAESAIGSITPLANELNLSKEQSQSLVKWYAEHMTEERAKMTAIWTDTVEKWQDEARKHPEYGGAKLDENVKSIRSMMERFVPNKEERESLLNDLQTTGMGNHPGLIAMLYRANKAIGEDTMPLGQPKSSESRKDLAALMFPTMNK
ncbi:hypothetical protein COW64_17295 [bacterium (Candidatus Blackallbacteria) CG18_big_fil_WC_8_21_14_2_50_49_26]|nr:MAG: hypothetical protein COW64_17295 [bacterium (Candidatus Blackallbacteria) CG18_big_fil_WC_8_21_14_2_50_49_26]